MPDEQTELTEQQVAIRNLDSLSNIIQDILNKANFQIMGNLNVLASHEIVLTPAKLRELADKGETICIRLVQEQVVDVVVRQPFKLILGRINGLKKVVDSLRRQLSGSRPAILVSTGNSEPQNVKE